MNGEEDGSRKRRGTTSGSRPATSPARDSTYGGVTLLVIGAHLAARRITLR